MEYINEIVKKVKPFANILIFFCLFTIAFIIIAGTIKYTIPFIIGLIAASILQKPTEFIIKRFNIRGEIAAIISTLIFYVITVSVLVVGVVYFSSEIKDLATEGYDYIYNNGSEISDMLQKSLSGFENIDESILDTLKTNITKFISDMSNYALDFSKGIVNGIINVVSALPYIISVIIFAILSSFVFLKKFIKRKYSPNEENKFNENDQYEKYIKIILEIKDIVFKYVGTYSFLVFCTFVITFIGFNILKIPY